MPSFVLLSKQSWPRTARRDAYCASIFTYHLSVSRESSQVSSVYKRYIQKGWILAGAYAFPGSASRKHPNRGLSQNNWQLRNGEREPSLPCLPKHAECQTIAVRMHLPPYVVPQRQPVYEGQYISKATLFGVFAAHLPTV